MAFFKKHHFKMRHPSHRPDHAPKFQDLMHPENTGSESDYLKSLVDSHAEVTVVLKDGERFHGHIRYYDQHCFSIGLSSEGPRIFLRKASISYIAEE
jgi:sRNA-binding regulator protein Hfq